MQTVIGVTLSKPHLASQTVNFSCIYIQIYIYTPLHELACNIATYCTSGCGIFMSRRQVKMQPKSAITTIHMLTSVIKYLLFITTTGSCLFHTVYRITRSSNAPVLIKTHCSCQLGYRIAQVCAITPGAIIPMKYRVILHGMGVGNTCTVVERSTG